MINLIPNEEKKRKVKDFYFRLLIVLFMILGASVLVAVIALVPSYFLSAVKKSSANTKLEMQKNEPIDSVDQTVMILAKDLDTKLNLIEKTKDNEYVVSQKVINKIILKKMPDIKVTEIAYDNNPLTGKTISVSGTALSRERLLLFSKTLADDSLFKKVDLPISNFVKGSNIQFYLNLIPY